MGERVLLLVRPEDVSVGAVDAPGLPATVTARTFQGAATIIQVRVDKIDTLATANLAGSTAAELAPGDRVTIVDQRRPRALRVGGRRGGSR